MFKNVDFIFEESVGKLMCFVSGDLVFIIYWIKFDNLFEIFLFKFNFV